MSLRSRNIHGLSSVFENKHHVRKAKIKGNMPILKLRSVRTTVRLKLTRVLIERNPLIEIAYQIGGCGQPKTLMDGTSLHRTRLAHVLLTSLTEEVAKSVSVGEIKELTAPTRAAKRQNKII